MQSSTRAAEEGEERASVDVKEEDFAALVTFLGKRIRRIKVFGKRD